MQIYAKSIVGVEGRFCAKRSPFFFRSIELLMARNGNLTSDLREAISKISEVGRLLAPLTSNTFEELSTSSREVPHVNRPTVNSEASDPQSIAPSRNVNHELQRLFPTLKRSNEQASSSSFRPAEHLTVRGGKKRKRQAPKANANCKKGKPVFRDIVLIPNPKHNRVPTHSARLQLERKGLVIRSVYAWNFMAPC